MLTIEQFSNSKFKESYKKYFITDVLEYQPRLFSEMIKQGRFVECGPKIMALQDLYEGQLEKKEEALVLLKEHIIQFDACYSKQGERMK